MIYYCIWDDDLKDILSVDLSVEIWSFDYMREDI